MNVILLCIGGACGAMARYRLGTVLLKYSKHGFPFGTFLINVTGALLLGIFSGLSLSGRMYFLLGDGFCGAFTTFSTFSVESVELIKRKEIKKSIVYIVLSLCVGLSCFLAGYSVGKLFMHTML